MRAPTKCRHLSAQLALGAAEEDSGEGGLEHAGRARLFSFEVDVTEEGREGTRKTQQQTLHARCCEGCSLPPTWAPSPSSATLGFSHSTRSAVLTIIWWSKARGGRSLMGNHWASWASSCVEGGGGGGGAFWQPALEADPAIMHKGGGWRRGASTLVEVAP